MLGLAIQHMKTLGMYLANLLNRNPITSLLKNTTGSLVTNEFQTPAAVAVSSAAAYLVLASAERVGEHDTAKSAMKGVIQERLSLLEVYLEDKRMSIEVADTMAAGSARWVCRKAFFQLFRRASVEVDGLKARLNAEVTTMDDLNAILIALQKQERAVKGIKGSYKLFLTALTGGGPEQLQVELLAAENWVERIHQNHPATPTPQSSV